jgi:hypothetical protein
LAGRWVGAEPRRGGSGGAHGGVQERGRDSTQEEKAAAPLRATGVPAVTTGLTATSLGMCAGLGRNAR